MSEQEQTADASREAYYDWWVENSPTDHSHHVVHGTKGSIEALKAVEAERDALREKLEERGRVFSENLLMQGEEITRLRADNLSLRLRDQTEQEQEIARLLAEREALRVELGEMALVLEQQTRTLTREHEQRERAEAALIAIRAGSIRLAAAGIVGHLHVVEQCSAALRDPAPAEGFFARGDDGHYRTDPAPSCPHGHPPGSARDCACHEEKP